MTNSSSPLGSDPDLPPVQPLGSAPTSLNFDDAYETLRAIAKKHMRGQTPSHTLQATALVSEAYLRLHRAGACARDLDHLLSQASRAMRHVLVDHARRRGFLKRQSRGGSEEMLAGLVEHLDDANEGLIGFDQALDKLAETDEELADLVERHVFGGQPLASCAEAFGISERQVYRRWQAARAFLHRELKRTPGGG